MQASNLNFQKSLRNNRCPTDHNRCPTDHNRCPTDHNRCPTDLHRQQKNRNKQPNSRYSLSTSRQSVSNNKQSQSTSKPRSQINTTKQLSSTLANIKRTKRISDQDQSSQQQNQQIDGQSDNKEQSLLTFGDDHKPNIYNQAMTSLQKIKQNQQQKVSLQQLECKFNSLIQENQMLQNHNRNRTNSQQNSQHQISNNEKQRIDLILSDENKHVIKDGCKKDQNKIRTRSVYDGKLYRDKNIDRKWNKGFVNRVGTDSDGQTKQSGIFNIGFISQQLQNVDVINDNVIVQDQLSKQGQQSTNRIKRRPGIFLDKQSVDIRRSNILKQVSDSETEIKDQQSTKSGKQVDSKLDQLGLDLEQNHKKNKRKKWAPINESLFNDILFKKGL